MNSALGFLIWDTRSSSLLWHVLLLALLFFFFDSDGHGEEFGALHGVVHIHAWQKATVYYYSYSAYGRARNVEVWDDLVHWIFVL